MGKRTRKSLLSWDVRMLPSVEAVLMVRMDMLLVSMSILFRMRRYFRLGMEVPIGMMAEDMFS